MELYTVRLHGGMVGSPARWLVLPIGKSGRENAVGLIERLGPAKGEEHPWKMYLGIGEGQRYLGATYQGMRMALELLRQNVEQKQGAGR